MPMADDVKSRHPLVDMIDRYAQGKKFVAGRPFWLCPFHEEKTPSFSVTPDGGAFVCFGCGAKGDVIEFIRKIEGLSFNEAVALLDGDSEEPRSSTGRGRSRPPGPSQPAPRPDPRALAIWRAGGPIAGTRAETYLRKRGIVIELPPSLRFLPSLDYHDGRGAMPLSLPAMVAGVQAPDRRVVAVHRTWLRPDGTGKAAVTSPKKMFGPCAGCAVRFAAATDSLVVAEGIETALAVMQATGRPTWAALSTSGLRSLIVPPDIREIVIAADGDAPGLEAADAAADRWVAEGRTVRIARPPGEGDFADLVAGDVLEVCDA